MKDILCRSKCGKRFASKNAERQHYVDAHDEAAAAMRKLNHRATGRKEDRLDAEPDYSGSCEVCGESPIVPATGMCGPCTFGEADTAGGNW